MSRNRVGNVARRRLIAQVILAVFAIAGYVIVVLREHLLPARFMYDAATIQKVALGALDADNKFKSVALVYRGLGLAEHPTLAALAGYTAYLAVLTLSIHASRRAGYGWLGVAVACTSIILAAVYLGQYSKDVVVLAVVALVLALPRRWYFQLMIAASMILYGLFFRDYWVVVAFAAALVWVVAPHLRVRWILLCGLGTVVAASVAIMVAFGGDPDVLRSTVNAGRGDFVAGSMISGPFTDSGAIGGLANNVLAYVFLIVPVPLIAQGGAYYVAVSFLVAFLWISFLWRASHARTDTIGRRAIATAVGLLCAQALFEPDYGSALRHLTPLLPLFVYVVFTGAMTVPRVSATESRRLSKVYIALNDLAQLGGLQTASRALGASLSAAGVDVAFLTIRGSGTGARPLFPTHIVALLRRLPLSGMKPERLDLIGQTIFVWRLRRTIRRDPRPLICMDVFVAELALRARLDVPTLFQFHNSFDAVANTRDLARITRIARGFDVAVALTNADADRFTRAAGKEFLAIPNIVPFPRSAPIEDARQNRTVVSVGRLSPEKRVDLLLSAWAMQPVDLMVEWSLLIVGDGPQKNDLEDQAHRLGVSESVSFTGARDDIQRILRESALFVLPSDYEGLPMCLVEAMSQGLACVATESAPGVTELLSDGPGLLVPVGDVRGFSAALTRVMRDSELRATLASAGFERSKSFVADEVLQKWKVALGDN